jgi:uridine kinase
MKPLVIGVAGGSGSGKSTVARRIAAGVAPMSVAFLEMDAYYRDFSDRSLDERRQVNWDHPDAVDLARLGADLDRLVAGEAVDTPRYDFVTHVRRPETERVEPADVVVVDGILLLVDAGIRARLDVKVFVDADPDIRLIRRLRRDQSARGRPLEEILEQYLSTVQPMHLQFVEPSKRYADLIVPRGGRNAVAIDLIVATVQRRLQAVPA